MKDGFVKVGCTSFDLVVGNVNHNTKEIIKCLNKIFFSFIRKTNNNIATQIR